MIKRLLLSTLLLTSAVNIQADDSWASFFGAFLGALFGSSSNQSTKPTTIIHVPIPVQTTPKCACGATAKDGYRMRSLTCCGAVVCDSCWKSRVETASRKGDYPKCHACGKTFGDIQVQNPRPSAPPVNVKNNNSSIYNNQIMCASGCYSASQVKFKCGHGMCKSCLRSRVDKARKEAQGGQPYVTCPACGDMLTLDIINRV